MSTVRLCIKLTTYFRLRKVQSKHQLLAPSCPTRPQMIRSRLPSKRTSLPYSWCAENDPW